jgi:hypothetical protein
MKALETKKLRHDLLTQKEGVPHLIGEKGEVLEFESCEERNDKA